ncbi:hypothetical protein CDAR_301851 [Caerostris darwini]|uniref:Uncharacterized protein n=1 Tax=Caerostris darwini TaxID=1538125 RepID=A0AAV4VDZ4_9ARAC|nr:hypothetical protein CDAR_301851 [Caerostris darwini]
MLNPNRCAKKKAFFSGKMIAIKTHFSDVKRAVWDDGLQYRERAEEKIPNCVTFSPLRELFLFAAVTVKKNAFFEEKNIIFHFVGRGTKRIEL